MASIDINYNMVQAVAATLKSVWGFMCSYSKLQCQQVIEDYVVHGGDEGLTARSIRMACGLPSEDATPSRMPGNPGAAPPRMPGTPGAARSSKEPAPLRMPVAPGAAPNTDTDIAAPASPWRDYDPAAVELANIQKDTTYLKRVARSDWGHVCL